MVKSSLSKEKAVQLSAAVVECFETHPNEKTVHVVTDGTVFLNASKNAAINHARSIKGEVVTVNKGDKLPFDEMAEAAAATEEHVVTEEPAITEEPASKGKSSKVKKDKKK
jgi:GTP-binding protein EngB required for normal cell division